ncbi:MAG: aspartate 1-decarboxylase [bacterium]|nr:aspartate 1-decarboxylase [bacterium]
MEIQVLKSKLHYVTVTQAELDYIGSVTIDEDLMDAANLIENEQVHILNKNNGQRFVTYVLRGERGSGVICLNGPAALLVNLGDVVIIMSFATMEFEAAKKFRPWVVFPDTATNTLKK